MIFYDWGDLLHRYKIIAGKTQKYSETNVWSCTEKVFLQTTFDKFSMLGKNVELLKVKQKYKFYVETLINDKTSGQLKGIMLIINVQLHQNSINLNLSSQSTI